MANVRQGNTYFIDTASVSLAVPNIKMLSVTLTATAVGAILVLEDDAGTPVRKFELRLATSGDSKIFDYSEQGGIVFTNGIRVTTVTNCVATLVLQESRS